MFVRRRRAAGLALQFAAGSFKPPAPALTYGFAIPITGGTVGLTSLLYLIVSVAPAGDTAGEPPREDRLQPQAGHLMKRGGGR